ncbi:hypothetical protein HNP46_005831 [Pseudomonas nitritireducens]|uniref:Lipoprotein n=1 Tax=Pseudomonas nitroreducens TaxID=46680 RepID=A0A7W7KR11_PSENT|nr:hypothetical protein [Pseudomonas nitritireducens]MBB4866923.1 hypothetical protein [Pseudomonas nitritireducens]
MTRFLPLIFLVVLTGCTAQSRYGFVVDWQNVCSYPVEVSAQAFTNADGDTQRKQSLRIGESTQVLSIVSLNQDLTNSIPDDYSLDLAGNGRTLHLDKSGLLESLKRLPPRQQGNAIQRWALNDGSVCP